jgi:hypothetical protein
MISLIQYLHIQARARGITTSLNPQFDASSQWTGMKEVCEHLTFFIGNEVLKYIHLIANRANII